MKVKDGFALKKIAGTWVVLPLGERTLDFTGMLTLNESGLLLWKRLEEGCEREALVRALTEEYTVPYEEARADVEEFLAELQSAGCVEGN